jgi:hypothetical protein
MRDEPDPAIVPVPRSGRNGERAAAAPVASAPVIEADAQLRLLD